MLDGRSNITMVRQSRGRGAWAGLRSRGHDHPGPCSPPPARPAPSPPEANLLEAMLQMASSPSHHVAASHGGPLGVLCNVDGVVADAAAHIQHGLAIKHALACRRAAGTGAGSAV